MKKHLTLLGIAAMATAVLAGCSKDEVVESYRGEEISFKTRIATRAQEIATTKNLEKFYVWGDAEGYPEFFLKRGVATRKGEGGETGTTYDLRTAEGNKVYWPAGVHNIDFWAYGPAGIVSESQETVNKDQQQITDYTPDANTTEGGKNHKDLIVAHTRASHTTSSGANVELQFAHALSGITLDLKSGDPSKIMRLKGVWFVNAKNKGTLYYSKGTNQVINWDLTSATDATYGVTTDKDIYSISPISPITKDGTSRNDLMLIPQNTAALAFNDDGTVKTPGSYILLLCQIISKHEGAKHTDEATAAEGDTQYHYHLLFPETDAVYPSLDEVPTRYAYTCVPVAFKWEGGKRYNYNLTFCGQTSGGGIYPPETLPTLPTIDDITIITDRPSGKNPGSPVLDNPITFKVTITGWDDANADQDTPMN